MEPGSDNTPAEKLPVTFDWNSLDRTAVERIAETILNHGYAELENMVSDEDIRHACDVANQLVARHGNETVVYVGQEGLTGYILAQLRSDLETFFCDLFEAITGQPSEFPYIQQDARFLAGTSHNSFSGFYHFDSYVVGLIVPILLPEPGAGGDFILLPNARGLRQSYPVNVMQKAISQSPIMQKRFARRLADDRRFVRVPMTIGKAYLFNGHRSLHANESCIGDQRRFTVIFHTGNPFQASMLRKIGKQVRNRFGPGAKQPVITTS